MNLITKNASVYLVFFLLAFSTTLCAQRYEADYAELIQQVLGGEREVAIQSGYVDIMNDRYAIEVEFAEKWKQSIGQALWYGLQTNRQPGIVLIKRDPNDNRYVIQLGSALQYAGLYDRIAVWVWPDDFPGQYAEPSIYNRRSADPTPTTSHWLTRSSNIRHNPSCRYYKTTSGKYCAPYEGIPCKICGG